MWGSRKDPGNEGGIGPDRHELAEITGGFACEKAVNASIRRLLPI
ncbi:MAG: hypothetical protein QOI31_1451 [Solirubrobacterales bacterium]|jgi:hypothetical protein|nr:hypothetical protein [Solirubrobacterales bacterium]